MICTVCGVNKTDNPDGICDDCKASIVTNNDIPPKRKISFDSNA